MFSLLLTFICLANNFPVNLMHRVSSDVIDLSRFGERIFGKPVENTGLNGLNENPEELGPYLEGDLLIPTEARNGMRAESLRWKNALVPFEIRGGYNAFQMDLIERALNEYHKKSCIKFVPRRASDRDFVSIESGSSGCWSSVGRTGGKQTLNLQAPGCVSKIGTVIHELLHAVGFLHEQNREDRDTFVTIITKNIRQGYEVNFAKAKAGDTSAFGIIYDYGSVLHYSAKSFSKNGEPTIVAKQSTNEKMGQREGFSKKDVEKLNKMYNCKAVTGSAVEVPSTTQKPSESVFGSLIETLFPNSNMDEEEMIEQ